MLIVFAKRVLKSFLKSIKSILLAGKKLMLEIILKSWKGATIGIMIGLILFLILLDTFINVGIGWYFDVLVSLVLMAFIIFGIGYISKTLFKTVRKFDPRFVTVVIVAFSALSFLPMSFFGKTLMIDLFVCGGLVGLAFSKGIKKSISILLITLVIVFNGYAIVKLFSQGFDNTIPVSEKYWDQKTTGWNFEDPSLDGPFKVLQLTYGSGNDKRRPEYGKNVNLKTSPVDATPFFDQSKGVFNFLRKIYWGFNSKNYPINARVWYPDGNGQYPLILIVHGNHLMTDFSDPGYEYLGKFIASRGYIFVSIDENFLNGNWIHDYEQSEVFTRGWILLKHLEQWKKWNESDGNPFTKKVDMNNIVLAGHSRGGAAAVVAAAINKLERYHGDAKQVFNFNFSIKGVIQIAPNDPYNPQNEVPIVLENMNYLILQGGYDQDMHWFLGNRVYNRMKFSGNDYHFKSALYIYRANHGQFNTSWGRYDFPAPLSWFLNTKPIMKAENQRKIAKLYISAFLDASLKGKSEFIPLLKDYRNGKKYLPKEYYINQFEDSGFKYAADYQEDFDVTTASIKGGTIKGKNLNIWSENSLNFRDDGGSSQANLGVYLGWDSKDLKYKNKTAEYEILLPDSTLQYLKLKDAKNFVFFVCNNKNEMSSVDFSIALISDKDTSKISLNNQYILPPPLKTELTKWPFIFAIAKDKPVERVLQSIEIPLSDFIKANQNFNPVKLKEIKFIFDKTTAGEIFLDKIGFN